MEDSISFFLALAVISSGGSLIELEGRRALIAVALIALRRLVSAEKKPGESLKFAAGI